MQSISTGTRIYKQQLLLSRGWFWFVHKITRKPWLMTIFIYHLYVLWALMCEQLSWKHVFDAKRISEQSSNILQFDELHEHILRNCTPSLPKPSIEWACMKCIFRIFHSNYLPFTQIVYTLSQQILVWSKKASFNWMLMEIPGMNNKVIRCEKVGKCFSSENEVIWIKWQRWNRLHT